MEPKIRQFWWTLGNNSRVKFLSEIASTRNRPDLVICLKPLKQGVWRELTLGFDRGISPPET